MNTPSFSVIINTYNRVESLRVVLDALTQLDYPNFEVVVVNGPSTDGTATLLRDYAGRIKLADCPRRNLAESRNIGIAQAAGELVAFIDDDAYPDPAWLNHLAQGFAGDEIAAVGGPVYAHTGVTLQARYSMADAFGMARVDDGPVNPSAYYNNPSSPEFPYTIGTNSSFRRDVLIGIGGFDEEFEYYLEETDVCRRLVQRGMVVNLIDDGFVYHKFLPSDIRDANRAIKDRYSVVKNTCYFALKHALPEASFAEVCRRLLEFVDVQRDDLALNVAEGRLTAADLDRFESEVPRAFDAAFRAHMEGSGRRQRDPSWFGTPPPFLPYPTVRVAERRLTVCLLIQEWPPVSLNGIARVVLTLARGLAGTGHVVHVLTRGDGHDRVDLEDGVWVHRICTRSHPAPRGIDVPARIWDYSATLLDELERIDAHRRVDVVQFPNWDSEGIAALLTGRYRTVLGLYTPLRATRAVDPVLGAPSRELDQLEEVEKFCYLHADRLLACGPAIVHDIEERYRIVLDPGRLGYVAHAIEDAPSVVVPAGDPDHPEVLFVGRLEPRKGIDTLLECIPRLAARHPGAHFTIAGRDAHPWPDGRTVRQRFESSPQGRGLGDRVTFTGVLPDGELLRAYAGCDILVAPSRFESFGLILLEAMRFGKPVVACAVGGMTDIVEDGGNGLLVPPGEAGALEAALSRLLLSETLRAAYGARSRQLFVERYSIERMVSGVSREYDLASGRSTAGAIPGSLERPQTTVGGAEAPAGEGGGGAGAPSSAPLPAEPPAAAVPSIGDAHSRILDRLVCPTCHATPGIRARVVATDGRVRSGQVVCDTCGMVATVHGGKVDFLPEPAEPLAAGPPRAVAPPGELRLTARCPGVELTGIWHPESQGWVRSDGDPTDAIRYRGRFTDAVVRLLRHPYSGIADLYLDDSLVDSVDLFQDAGSTVVGFTIAEDIDFAPHTISVRPRGAAGPGSKGSQVIFEELVLGGPPGVEEFREPVPINRGNPYSAVIERCISECSPSGLILEVGGGDRRRVDSRHLNVEFLKFELADLYADIHHLPFADGTFELVFSQAVFEHVAHPFEAAQELIRVTRPGGTILTEVAFMQPLHAVPYHYFNMTPWGAEELFRSCEILETDWFGDLSFTVDWLMRSVNLDRKVGSRRMRKLAAQFVKMDALVSHEELRPAASGVYVIARKPG